MEEYIIISGLDLQDPNRGTAALGYGSFSFLKEKGVLTDKTKILSFHYYWNFLKKKNWGEKRTVRNIQGINVEFVEVKVPNYEKVLFLKFNKMLLFGKLRHYMSQVKYVAAINGGDGFSDIYTTSTFMYRLTDTFYAMKAKVPVILLPQTIGPFYDNHNRTIAEGILKYAAEVYVRDDRYVSELDNLGVKYELTKDLSYYMRPEDPGIDILPHAIGLNISGLAYSNAFRGLSGQFDNYKYMIEVLIQRFQTMNFPVYIIPHSYDYNKPELNNDDMEASREVYSKLKDKENVFLIDRDLISPQVKYCISKMSYFIGTRMHANFAAIYTGVPLYGLAYSYKFEGAFKANGAYDNNISEINNITKEEANAIIEKIVEDYNRKHK